MFSMITAPPTRIGNCRPIRVITGMRAFLMGSVSDNHDPLPEPLGPGSADIVLPEHLQIDPSMRGLGGPLAKQSRCPLSPVISPKGGIQSNFNRNARLIIRKYTAAKVRTDPLCHSCESGNPGYRNGPWIPGLRPE